MEVVTVVVHVGEKGGNHQSLLHCLQKARTQCCRQSVPGPAQQVAAYVRAVPRVSPPPGLPAQPRAGLARVDSPQEPPPCRHLPLLLPRLAGWLDLWGMNYSHGERTFYKWACKWSQLWPATTRTQSPGWASLTMKFFYVQFLKSCSTKLKMTPTMS